MARSGKRMACALRSASSPAQICGKGHNGHNQASSSEDGTLLLPQDAVQDSPAGLTEASQERRPPRARSRQNIKDAGMTPLGSRSPPSRHNLPNGIVDKITKDMTPVLCHAPELPLDDDFVEGGVELSPSKDLYDGFSGDEGSSPLPTRMLKQLEPQELERMWPCRDGQSNALFLDYDGTLREFEGRPELAVPSPELMDLLTELNARKDLVPHIISGRNQEFLQEHFGRLSRFTLIAEHGFQISPAPAATADQLDGPERRCSTPLLPRNLPEHNGRSWELWEQYGGNVRYFKDHENWKVIMRAEITRLVRETPGSHLEEKRSSLVWHYREVVDGKQGEAAALRAVQELEMLRDKEKIQDVKIAHGHKVVEVSYRNVRKGLVMRRLCEEKALFGQPFAGVLVAGDDVSDETMFEAAPRDFLTIKVGFGATAARFRVDTPSQLRDFLWRITST